MTLFYSQQDRLRDPAGRSRNDGAGLRRLARHTIGHAIAALEFMHRAIVAAKTRRLARELMLHGGAGADGLYRSDGRASDGEGRDAAKYPQHPLILGDKWDF